MTLGKVPIKFGKTSMKKESALSTPYPLLRMIQGLEALDGTTSIILEAQPQLQLNLMKLSQLCQFVERFMFIFYNVGNS